MVFTSLETSRSHTAAGAFGAGPGLSGGSVMVGGVITAATNASPVVVTTTSPHGLVVGDQVQVSGITTNTGANGLWTLTAVTATTATLGGSVGNGVSGGLATATMSQALDISGITTDWQAFLRVQSMTAAKKAIVSLQDSADGFVNDIVTLASWNIQGAVVTGAYKDLDKLRKYDIPSARFGVANGRLRLYVQSIDGSATLVVTAGYEN